MRAQLWLLRHAEAEPRGTRADADRRLTERGEQQARGAGMAIARLGPDFDAVLVSPKERARQTAQIAAEHWPQRQRELIRVHEPLAEGFHARQARSALAAVGEHGRLLLVGHEPDFSELVRELTGARVDIKKGGLAAVRLGGRGGELVLLLAPRELAAIAGAPGGWD